MTRKQVDKLYTQAEDFATKIIAKCQLSLKEMIMTAYIAL